ncbi:hypothetical protein WN944_013902 [Citrus x changshan-huyou]|uniref:Uncharacterized protein n=1 Tax=Citrus x changshan-huyou TaxID=2935761 RepID=A0AAP0M8Z4_9ROSI
MECSSRTSPYKQWRLRFSFRPLISILEGINWSLYSSLEIMGFYSWIRRFYLSSFSHGIYRDGSEGGAMMALNLELPILFQELG